MAACPSSVHSSRALSQPALQAQPPESLWAATTIRKLSTPSVVVWHSVTSSALRFSLSHSTQPRPAAPTRSNSLKLTSSPFLRLFHQAFSLQCESPRFPPTYLLNTSNTCARVTRQASKLASHAVMSGAHINIVWLQCCSFTWHSYRGTNSRPLRSNNTCCCQTRGFPVSG